MAGEEFKEKPKKTKNKMAAQTRLIITGLFVSTLFILFAAWFADFSINNNMLNAYRNFAQIIAKTLAIE